MSVTDVYDYSDLLKDKLAKQGLVVEISQKFKKINDNAERVKFLESQLLKHDLMPTEHLKLDKSDSKAEKCRHSGNQKYKKKKFLSALESYNKSICFSTENSENIATAYANRSAVYFELGLYEMCLEDIQRAFKHDYINLDKLNDRAQRCNEKINNESDVQKMIEPFGKDFFKLSRAPHSKVPFIANCLELKSDAKFGRYIVTNAALQPGEIIAIEEPFSKCLLRDQNYKYCCNCLSDNCLNLIPCKVCTSAMFCSEECYSEGYKKFHRFECTIVDKLNQLCTKIIRIALHTFFEALDVYNCNVLDLMNALNEIADDPSTVFDHDMKGGKIKRSRVLATIDSLVTNEEHRNSADLFQRSGIVAIITHLFLNHTTLSNVLCTQQAKDFFRKFIFKQTQIAALNYHGIFEGVMNKSETSTGPQFASGSYPFCSLINHSCAPNLVRVSHECKNFIMVNRPIKAGDQLFDNYGFHHCLETHAERQNSLKSQYMFDCCCEACKNYYPLYKDLPLVTGDFSIYLGKDVEELTQLNVNTARIQIKNYCQKLKNLDAKYPCHEISTLQECILRCTFIFKLTPLKLKLMEE